MSDDVPIITRESFIADFTGQLSTYRTKHNLVFTFNKPYPRIQKGVGYMMEFNSKTKQIRMIPVIG